MSKTWLITGASRGFGRTWAEAALARGDRVAATARRPEAVDDLKLKYGDALLPLALDVTDRAAVFSAIARAWEHFDGLDVVIPAAGYGLLGAIEEVSEQAARANMETNFFGTLSVVQAVLPRMRAQGSGHILPVSSLGGLVALPMFFQPTKWAVEAMAESLSEEVKHLNIRVTLIEPGSYGTEFFTGDSLEQGAQLADYDDLRAELAKGLDPAALGDPSATPKAIFAAVDAADPPLRLILGSTSLPVIEQAYERRIALWREWAAVSNAAQG